MGYVDKETIEEAAEWLMNKLQIENPLRYGSVWSNGVGELADKDKEFTDRTGYSMPLAVDLAVWQLKDQGFVTTKLRKDLPKIDDTGEENEIDYEIFFNWQKLRKPKFVSMDL